MTDEEKMKYLHNDDEVFTIRFSFVVRDNRVLFYPAGTKRKGVETFWADFLWPTYEQAMLWRSSCQHLNEQTRVVVTDEARLDKIKVIHLLSDWYLKEIDSEMYGLHRATCGCDVCKAMKQEKMRGVDGALTEESRKILFGSRMPLVRQMVEEMNIVLGV